MEEKEWISTQEAAERLGVTSARIRQMVAEKQIGARKMGSKYRGQWQINLNDVEKRLHEKGVTQTMRVKNRMTPNPIVANPKTNYNEALRLMKQNQIKHLPILDEKGKPIGIVTQHGMLHATPSPVTTLNVFEIATFLDNVTMESIMTSPVLAVDESCSITNAANFMLINKIDSLLVMRDETLVGIITSADIFRTFVEITGGGQPGTRIEARLPNEKGHLAPFIQALSNAGSYIVSLALSSNEDDYGYWDVKERGGNEDEIRKELDKLGYAEIISFRPSDSDKLLTLGKD
ncbi:MAG: CBS domain-containing protein [Desulfobulbaceae bacterium]|nr:CBS domain-containing protein [Desulfobulbaceae bacterium]